MTDKEIITTLSTKELFDFNDLLDLVKVLRGENGCPWDKEQTNKSIRNSIIDETYEFIEGLDSDNDELMCEELGDVLFQIIFHASIKSDEKIFNIDDIINGICKKMILRHPHVFGETKVENSTQVLSNWEKIKSAEKQRKTPYEQLDSVSKALPSLMRCAKLQSKAIKYGLTGNNDTDKYISDTEICLEQIKKGNADSEILGKLLFAVSGIVRTKDFEPEEVLYHENSAFIEQFQ